MSTIASRAVKLTQRCQVSIPQETMGYVAILAVVTIGAIMREINLLIILAGMMLGPLLVSWQTVRATLRRLEVSCRTSDAVSLGELLVIEVTVKNPRRRLDAWALAVEDQLRRVDHQPVHPGATRTNPSLFIPHVPAGGTATATYRGRLWQRGRYQFGPLRISTRVPLGLLRGTVAFDTRREVLVYPRLGRLSTRWNELVKIQQVGNRSQRRNQGPLEGDFYGLRDWRSGDSRRWIHWRSSARRGQLVVRQFEQSRSTDMILLLDLWKGPQGQASAEVQERAISFVATAVADHCRRGSGQLVVGTAAQEIQVVRGPASTTLLREVLEILTEVRPSDRDQLPAVMDRAITTASQDNRIVVVSSMPLDLQDTQRFAPFWNDPQRRGVLGQAICLDASAEPFSQIFALDDPPMQDISAR